MTAIDQMCLAGHVVSSGATWCCNLPKGHDGPHDDGLGDQWADVDPEEPIATDEVDAAILRGLIDRRIEAEGPDFDYADPGLVAYARSVRAALERAHLLLPSGGEASTQWGVLNVHSEFASTICSERVAAERTAAAFQGEGDYVASRTVTTWGEGHGQTKLVGPWVAVVSDNSEAVR